MKKSTSYKNKTKAELIKKLEELRSEKEFSRKSLKPGEDERSRELAELLPIVTFELDTDGMITYLNRKGFETFQFSAEDFQDGLHVLTCIAPERRHYTGSNVSRLLNGEKLLVSEQLAQRKDGTVFPAITHSSPIYHNGQIIGIRGILIDVTKEKKAEEALRKSEEKYRRFFEEDLSGISVSDINGNILECNNSFVKLFKYKSIKDAKSVNAFDYYVRKEDRMKLLNIIMYTKRFFNYELQMKNVRGEIFDVIMNVEGLFEDGRLMGIRTYIFDNTERKKAQEELKQREEIFRGLFENSSASMMIFDPKDASYKYVNQAACNFYGYSKEELLKMSIRDLSITPQEKIKDKISEVLQNNSFHFTFQHRLSNSELRDVEVYGNKIFIGGKELIFEIIHDITERQKAEKELEEYKIQLEKIIEERTAKLVEVNEKLIHEIQRLNVAEERIQDQFRFLLTLMDNIPVPIYIQNVKGIFLQSNRRFQEFIGLDSSEITGKSTSAIMPEEVAGEFGKFTENIILRNTSASYEMNFRIPGREDKQIVNNKVSFRYSDGSVKRILGIIIDITEQKKLETEILNALNSEKELHELKSRFISTASHEFRTPLTSIRLYSDLLAMYGRNIDTEKYMEHLNKIQKSVGYMTDLIDDVLTISRADTGKIRFNPVPLDLRKFCYDLIYEQKPLMKENHIVKLRYESEYGQVLLDEKLLKHILANLVSNAIKYSPEGGDIEFIVEFENDNIIFTISDNGIGIPGEDQKSLFEYFHRAENASGIPGTGLGLSIVKKSVDLHGGKISFCSSLNKGTTFRVILPFRQ